MKTYLVIILIIYSLFFFQGCASYQKKLNAWIGHSIDEFVLNNGTPTKVYILSSGDKIYEFYRSVTIPYTPTLGVVTGLVAIAKPGKYGENLTYYNSMMQATKERDTEKYLEYYCHTQLLVDGLTNTIKSAKHSGNGCW